MLIREAHQAGFSVIEIMVAVALLALLLTFGLPTYFIYLQNQQIRALAESVQSGLQLARAEAVSRNVTQGVQFVLTGNNWTVQVPSTGEKIRTVNGSERTANAAITPKPDGSTTITFNGMGRVVSPTIPANTRIWFDVRNSAAGKCIEDDASASVRCLAVTVSASGQIRMCDPSLDKASDKGVSNPLSCQDTRPS
jgi:type IV fimbrial biogenesis protein FimT